MESKRLASDFIAIHDSVTAAVLDSSISCICIVSRLELLTDK